MIHKYGWDDHAALVTNEAFYLHLSCI